MVVGRSDSSISSLPPPPPPGANFTPLMQTLGGRGFEDWYLLVSRLHRGSRVSEPPPDLLLVLLHPLLGGLVQHVSLHQLSQDAADGPLLFFHGQVAVKL